MKYLLLWLEGPMQSWGYDSKFSLRSTLTFPTKSGISGLLLSAMGAGGSQEDLLRKLNSGSHTVYAFQNKGISPSQIVDYQVVGNGYSSKGWESLMIPRKRDGGIANTGGAKLTYRYYLQDAIFSVIVSVPSDLIDEVAQSLKSPVWPIYLGRKNCVPTKPIFRGVFENFGDAENELEKLSENLESLFKVVEGNFPDDGEVYILDDVAVCFGPNKKYSSRYVTLIKEKEKRATD